MRRPADLAPALLPAAKRRLAHSEKKLLTAAVSRDPCRYRMHVLVTLILKGGCINDPLKAGAYALQSRNSPGMAQAAAALILLSISSVYFCKRSLLLQHNV